ncbi:glycosyltransferase [Psychroserpens sp. SPM9]|uniref:glycosyltransferase n=1 Tax=Psychroserpens sp. SPM9 TaxID=2975598 RepID=UPI0021A73A8F|nr:glycosyltransferase [Psychroserpens sp. SPM9]MDG5492249.1 glycosyltransferase [Psychroserpens sp. SPM9]
MITYLHQNFIIQAIESVLMQQTNFEFEFIIADDCSKDQTVQHIERVLKNHEKSEVIKLISHSENKGMYDNFMFALEQCQGTYIALCEGDDYWTDPLKLQKQVDFLEANADFEVCFTNINIVNKDNHIVKEQLIPSERKNIYEQKDLPIWAPTLTRVFRNRNFQNVLPNVPGLDTVMLLYQSNFGKIKCLDEITGSYRLHEGGVFSSKSKIKKIEAMLLTMFGSLKLIDRKLYLKYYAMIFKKLLALKIHDVKRFRWFRKLWTKNYRQSFKKLRFSEHIKIWVAFSIISMPFILKHKKTNQFFNKVLNKLLVY